MQTTKHMPCHIEKEAELKTDSQDRQTDRQTDREKVEETQRFNMYIIAGAIFSFRLLR